MGEAAWVFKYCFIKYHHGMDIETIDKLIIILGSVKKILNQSNINQYILIRMKQNSKPRFYKIYFKFRSINIFLKYGDFYFQIY